MSMEYDVRVLDIHDEGGVAALEAFALVVSQAFHDGAPSELTLKVFVDTVRADEPRLVGVYLPADAFGAGPHPIGTFASFDKTLNAGLDLVDVHMITDITVSPAHRRRGLLTRLMLDDLAATDCPVAALTVTEGSIYGRFGFGPATFRRQIEVETTTAFAFRSYVDPGRCEVMEPSAMGPVVRDLFARFHARTRGSLDRPAFYDAMLTGALDFASGGPDTKLRGVVHLDAEGQPDGYAQWKVLDGESGRAKPVAASLLSLGDDAHLGLWQFLAGIDLTDKVVDRASRADDVLDWSLANHDLLTVKGVTDQIWLRVLDVPVALAARPWFADDTLVLGVDDPLGHAHGNFTITASGGRASISATDAAPDVALDAETLSTLYLGGVSVRTLARAGRVTGSTDAVDRLTALMDGGAAPYALTSF